jgi:hypothetical protein
MRGAPRGPHPHDQLAVVGAVVDRISSIRAHLPGRESARHASVASMYTGRATNLPMPWLRPVRSARCDRFIGGRRTFDSGTWRVLPSREWPRWRRARTGIGSSRSGAGSSPAFRADLSVPSGPREHLQCRKRALDFAGARDPSSCRPSRVTSLDPRCCLLALQLSFCFKVRALSDRLVSARVTMR